MRTLNTFAMIFCLVYTAPASAKCKYNTSNAANDCLEALRDAGPKILRDSDSNSTEKQEKRVHTLKGAIKECYECTTEKLDEAAKKATTDDE
jgi:hypothetical protein